ncbi:hypothetical protein LJ737_09920 [Hymenobacter sp. 15J16-1T3B]|uniref:hypothetical protein n=1 Tax=Hymenobacter sp. 15J16-1T3B TaxID=2886941 RepID=UPI001D11868A|nr:hypothetical protein [Hymenobacter sp. 15J16-1T3B]MCC3157557.1 hypothetical protein [Hymenobacter sp. 15J16-1T3B]
MSPLSGPVSRYYHNPAAVISHPLGTDYLHLAWSATKTSPDELRAVYEQALRALQHFGLHKVLSDHTQRPPLPADVSEWVAQEWIPRAVQEAGYSHCAVVENHAPLGRLAAQSIGAQLPTGLLTFRYFATLPEAAAWLQAQ